VDAIQQTKDDLSACMCRGDAPRLARLYCQDAMLLPPGSDFVEGTEEIQTFWRVAMDAGISGTELVTLELHDFGGMAVEIGTYKLQAAHTVVDSGKYVILWRQEDLDWKLYRQVWNTGAVAKKATAA
jgi:ketosteroid isomerase-like protein